MTDIVERLSGYASFYRRRPAKAPDVVPQCSEISYRETQDTALIFEEAREEITRLRSRVAELENGLTDTLSMLRAAHMQCGIHHAGNKRVIKARSLLSQSTENGK